MKVLIGLVGRFHAVEVCLGLKKHGHNVKISTTMPKFVMKKYLDVNLIISYGILGLINHFRFFLGKYVAEKINLIIHKLLSKFLINDAIKYDVVITWSLCSLELYKSNKFQKKNKILKILECGSTHINHKVNILEKIYEEKNFEFKIDKVLIDRELEEYNLADKIFVPSNFVKNTFIKNGISPNKIYVNPYGVDLNTFYLDKTNKAHKEKITLLFCGNASLRKGFHLLIDAAEHFSAMNVELLHVGMISREIKLYMKNRNISSIKFLGQIEQKKLIRFYNLADALILPSFEEGLSLVQLQSLACGTPIISSIAAGVEDIFKNKTLYLGETIKLVTKQNILSSIQLFIDNKHKIDKVQIVDYCSKNFSIKSYSDRYENFIIKNSFKNEI